MRQSRMILLEYLQSCGVINIEVSIRVFQQHANPTLNVARTSLVNAKEKHYHRTSHSLIRTQATVINLLWPSQDSHELGRVSTSNMTTFSNSHPQTLKL